MVVLCTIKCNWENIVFGKILCTYVVYFKIEIHRLPIPICEYLASRANVWLVHGKNLLSSIMARLGILYSDFTEGLPCCFPMEQIPSRLDSPPFMGGSIVG